MIKEHYEQGVGALPTEIETLWDFLFSLFLNIMYDVLLVGGISLMGVYYFHHIKRENVQIILGNGFKVEGEGLIKCVCVSYKLLFF